MTARDLSLTSRKSFRRSCTMTLPPISTGISTRPIRNVLVVTAARYSRRAITNVFRMAAPLLLREAQVHQAPASRVVLFRVGPDLHPVAALLPGRGRHLQPVGEGARLVVL